MELNLDYTLTPTERLNYINSLQLDQYTPHQLEYLTNYLLYLPQDPKTATTLELDDYTQPSDSTKYTAPRPPIPWNCPELRQLAQARALLTSLIERNTALQSDPKYIAFLKRWRKELSQDSAPILEAYYPRIPSRPTFSPSPPIEIEDHIDYTNSFHIKQIVLHYKMLRRSPNSTPCMDYIDKIIEYAHTHGNLTDWQLYLLRQRLLGKNQISIAIKVAEKFDKIISPSAMSTAMRTIYKTLASAAAQMELDFADKSTPSKWRKCGLCGQTKHVSKYHWYEKKKYCKTCEKGRRKNGA